VIRRTFADEVVAAFAERLEQLTGLPDGSSTDLLAAVAQDDVARNLHPPLQRVDGRREVLDLELDAIQPPGRGSGIGRGLPGAPAPGRLRAGQISAREAREAGRPDACRP